MELNSLPSYDAASASQLSEYRPLANVSAERDARVLAASTPIAKEDAQQRLSVWQQTGDIDSALAGADATQQQELVWSWYRNDTLNLNKGQQEQLKDFLIGDKPERWTEMFRNSSPATAQVDGLLLRKELRDAASFGKQQESLALQILGEVKSLPNSEGVQLLLRNELMALIPRNGMLDNMMRNTHKPDLE